MPPKRSVTVAGDVGTRRPSLQEMTQENDSLRQELNLLTARKREIEANLFQLTERLEKLESGSAVKEATAAMVSRELGAVAPRTPREPALAQLEEALHYADKALQGLLMEPRGDAAAGATAVGDGALREAFGALTSASPLVEQRLAATMQLLKERLAIPSAPTFGARAPPQDFDVGDTCEGQDISARWWPVLITAKNTDGSLVCDVLDGFNSTWTNVRQECLQQAGPAKASAPGRAQSPRKHLEGELEMVQQQLRIAQMQNQQLAEVHQQLTATQSQHRDLTEAHAVTQEQFRRASQELEALRQQSNSTASAAAQELLTVRTQYAELVQVFEEQKRHLQEHRMANEQASSHLSDLQKRVQDQESRLAELPSLRTECQQQAEIANTRANQLQELTQQHAAQHEKLKEQHQAQVESACAAAAKEAYARALDFAQLEPSPNEEELAQERQANAELRSQLQRAEEQLDFFKDRMQKSEKLQKERDDMKNRLAAATRRLEDVGRSAAVSAAPLQMPLFAARPINATRTLSPTEIRGGSPLVAGLQQQTVGANLTVTGRLPSTLVGSSLVPDDATNADAVNASGSTDQQSRPSRLAPGQSSPRSGSISGIQTPGSLNNATHSISNSSPRLDNWRAVNSSAVSSNMGSSARRQSPEPPVDSALASAPAAAAMAPPPAPVPFMASAPIRGTFPFGSQVSPLRSTNGDMPGSARSLPQQFLGTVPKTQVRYVSPLQQNMPASASAAAAHPTAAPPPSSAGGNVSSPGNLSPATLPAKPAMPFMLSSQPSGFTSPLAYPASPKLQVPQLASSARELLSRSSAPAWPVSYSSATLREQSPAYRFTSS